MSNRSAKAKIWLVAATLLLVGGAAFLVWWIVFRGDSYQPPPITFDGESDKLKQTLIVPTLDTPVPEGKSVVWCSSFQLAWNELKTKLAKGPVQLKNAQEIAERLNGAKQTKKDLSEESVYAEAGKVGAGILDTIRREMAKRFPKAPLSDLQAPKNAVVAFAYLSAGVKFKHPYYDMESGMEFTDSAGGKIQVQAFGVNPDHHGDNAADVRRQIAVLYANTDPKDDSGDEYILDLDKNSQPYQLVLAGVPWNKSLADTLADVEAKIAAAKPNSFSGSAQLLVPVMHWKVRHRFQELEGQDKQFLNPPLKDYFLAKALQSIHFQLDRSGTQVTSQAYIVGAMSAMPTRFYFNRPFLLYLKKRDAVQPFFVMWVDNAELLAKR